MQFVPGGRHSLASARFKMGRELRFRCMFDRSCEYQLAPQANHTFNRLCGIQTSESFGVEVFIGWRFNASHRRFELAACTSGEGGTMQTILAQKAWPRANSIFDVTFKTHPHRDGISVFISSPDGKLSGDMEVFVCKLLPNDTQRILYPRFIAGQGAPQPMLIRLKHGQF